MLSGPEPHKHAVKFYDTDSSLFGNVAEFLARGLVDGHPAVIIATASHSSGILAALGARLIDVPEAIRRGQLTLMDADAALAAFMVDDTIDLAAFDQHVGGCVVRMVNAHAARGIVRVYGELVDVLWRQRRQEAAIRLEILWNGLIARSNFELLCGYAMGSFYKETDLLERVCGQHSHVVPPFDVLPESRLH